jgi:hypothetical protein
VPEADKKTDYIPRRYRYSRLGFTHDDLLERSRGDNDKLSPVNYDGFIGFFIDVMDTSLRAFGAGSRYHALFRPLRRSCLPGR